MPDDQLSDHPNPSCAYCGNDVTTADIIQVVGDQPLHNHCYLLMGAESLGLTLNEFSSQEIDALNLLLSENAEQPSQE